MRLTLLILFLAAGVQAQTLLVETLRIVCPLPVPDSTNGIYVDTVAGSDSNLGTSNSPFATIAAAEAELSAGTNLFLKRGSHWREQLDVAFDGVTVESYGTGALPLLDASSVIESAWTQTEGQTNLYQTTVSWDSGTAWFSVWEDTNRLVRATNLNNCDTTPGSYYPSSDSSSPITLYVHASDSDNPETNGAVYEYASRSFGLDGKPYDGVTDLTVSGIATRRNACNNGSIQMNGVLLNSLALDGTKHNILISGNSRLTNVTCGNAYYTAGAAIMIVANENTPAGPTIIYDNVVCTNATVNANLLGWYAHPNVSGGYSNIYWINCATTNLGKSIDPSATNNNVVIGGAYHANVPIESGAFRISITNATIVGATRGFQADGNSTTTNYLDGVTFAPLSGAGYQVYAISSANVVVNNCSFSGTSSKIAALASGSRFTAYSNTMTGSGMPWQIVNADQPTADFNSYASGVNFSISEIGAMNFAAWKTATGEDANSTNP